MNDSNFMPFILLIFGGFACIGITLYQMKVGSGVLRGRRGWEPVAELVRKDEEPQRFRRSIVIGFLLGFMLIVLGILSYFLA